jgi:hypothetical protein
MLTDPIQDAAMGRPIRRTPDEWKAIEKTKAFWSGAKALTALIFVIVIGAALAVKIGSQVTGINSPSGLSDLLLVILVGTVVLVVGMAFR